MYQFTFRDSQVVSTKLGSLCTLFLLIILCLVIVGKFFKYAEWDPDTFIVTDGIEHAYFSTQT